MLRFLLLFCVLFLSACGGGGGSTGGGGGGGVTPPVNIVTLSKTNVSFQVRHLDDNPAPNTVRVSWSDARVSAIVVGYPPNVTQVD